MGKPSKKEQREILNNYRMSMIIGIVSGLIVVATINLYNFILANTSPPFSVPLAVLVSSLLLIFLIWYFVERPIKLQEEIWTAKIVRAEPYKKR